MASTVVQLYLYILYVYPRRTTFNVADSTTQSRDLSKKTSHAFNMWYVLGTALCGQFVYSASIYLMLLLYCIRIFIGEKRSEKFRNDRFFGQSRAVDRPDRRGELVHVAFLRRIQARRWWRTRHVRGLGALLQDYDWNFAPWRCRGVVPNWPAANTPKL